MTNRFLILVGASTFGSCALGCGGDDDTTSGIGDAAMRADSGAMSPGLDGGAPTLDAGPDASAQDGGSTQNVTLRFKATVGEQDLVCGQTYAHQGSSHVSITPQDFRFFIQEVRLISASGVEVPLTFDERLPYQSQGVALLDFTDGSGACTSGDPGTNMILTGSVPAGDYTGLVFVNGVPEALNHADPTLAPAPLQAPGASWGWLFGYRFLMAELVAVRDSDAGFDASAPPLEADGGIATTSGVSLLHVGSTGCTGTEGTGIQCSNVNRSEIRLNGFDVANSTIIADLGAVFSGVDLSDDVQCHSSGPDCGPMFQALGVDFATGAPLSTQTVYRVE